MANLIIIYQYSNLSFLWTTTTFWVFRKLLQKNKSKRLIRNWLWNTILYVFVNFRIRIVTMYPRPRRNLPKYQRLIRFCQTLSKDDNMMTLRDQMLKGQQIEMPWNDKSYNWKNSEFDPAFNHFNNQRGNNFHSGPNINQGNYNWKTSEFNPHLNPTFINFNQPRFNF